MSKPLHRVFVLRSAAQVAALGEFVRSNFGAFAEAGRPLAVTVAEAHAKRSREQNKRLWALLGQVAENAWVGARRYSPEQWHEHFKRAFIGTEDLPDGSTAGISTRTLSVEEFSAYMDRIEHFATESLGIELE